MKRNFIKAATLFACVYFSCVMSVFTPVQAKEGIWLPPTIKGREADMKAMGLQIPVEQLYNDEGTGLNNAVVLFARGCTGEFISAQGLVLTNHHCGYGTVQGLSSMVNDYFARGFWAMNMQEEIPCPGLTVTVFRKMNDVTVQILGGLPDTLSVQHRKEVIEGRIATLERSYSSGTLEAMVKPYFNGNQYWIIFTETYRDVRLVGFPPNGIGAFGGDTDNWMWPRHNGDFALFRVYAGKNNEPADYAPENRPYNPKRFFTINTGGYKEGDFTMVYGFPGVTQEYITSSQLNQVYSIIDPVRIEARTQKLKVWNERMEQSRDVFLKYTSKKAGVANGWKKWQGELRGLQLNNVMDKKRAYEQEFQVWASGAGRPDDAADILSHIEAVALAADSAVNGNEYIRETVLGIELIQQGALLDDLLARYRKGIDAADAGKIKQTWRGFAKNYDFETDRQLFEAMMPLFFEKGGSWIPASYRRMYREHGADFSKWARHVYAQSLLTSGSQFEVLIDRANPADSIRILEDPVWQLYNEINKVRTGQINPVLSDYYSRLEELNGRYLKYRMQKDGPREYYPDANLTLRITYGQIKGIDPEGPAEYAWQTDLNQTVAKDQPGSHEFSVPEKLKELHARKDYGRWAVNGTVPVNFIADNHTTGGNSGSPVLNARGELIGTNFDRIWEGTMSDLYFDPNLCRNISVDIRYTLFIIEKFGNAGWLLKEMKVVRK